MTTATEQPPATPEFTTEQAQQAYSEGFNNLDEPLLAPDAELEDPPPTEPPTPAEAQPTSPPETPPAPPDPTAAPETPPATPPETPPATPPAPTDPPVPTLESLQEEIRRQSVVMEEMRAQNKKKFQRLDGTVGGQKKVLQTANAKIKELSGKSVTITEADIPELMHEYPEFGKHVLAGMNRVEARRYGADPSAPPPAPQPAAPAATAPPVPPPATPPNPETDPPNQPAPEITDPESPPAQDPEQAQSRHDMSLVYPGWENTVYSQQFQDWLNGHGVEYAEAIRNSSDPWRVKAEIERFHIEQQPPPATTPPPPDPPHEAPPLTPQEQAERRFGGQVPPATTPGRAPLPGQKTDREYVSEGFKEVAAAQGDFR